MVFVIYQKSINVIAAIHITLRNQLIGSSKRGVG